MPKRRTRRTVSSAPPGASHSRPLVGAARTVEFVSLRGAWDRPWKPPPELLETALAMSRDAQIPLAHVIQVLAFGRAKPTEFKLVRAAYRMRAARALFAAGRGGRVVLFGTKAADRTRAQIDALEFDMPLTLDAYDENTIRPDLGADSISMPHFIELRERPAAHTWRTVTVDRKSFFAWLKKLSSRSAPVRASRAIDNCFLWLVELRREGRPTKTKVAYKAEAIEKFKIGPDQFRRAWERAASQAPSDGWSEPGRPPKLAKSTSK